GPRHRRAGPCGRAESEVNNCLSRAPPFGSGGTAGGGRPGSMLPATAGGGRRPGSGAQEIAKAAQTKAAPKEKRGGGPAEETPQEVTTDAPLPLLDLSDAAVKKMIKSAKKRGYVTYEQINAVLPSEEVTSEQIEDILAMLNEMGINTVEQEENEAEDEEKPA